MIRATTNVSVLRQSPQGQRREPSHFTQAVAPSGDRVAVLDHHVGSAVNGSKLGYRAFWFDLEIIALHTSL